MYKSGVQRALILFPYFVFFLALFFSCSKPTQAQQNSASPTISVATFNIRILSDRSRDDYELTEIARLVSKFDLIAVQEARDLIVLERLVRILNEVYHVPFSFDATPPLGRGVKELYTFLWRNDRIRAEGNPEVFADPDDVFIREPAWQEFSVINGGFDFVAITFHSIFGSSEHERVMENSKLPGVVRGVQAKTHAVHPKEEDFLLLGDFNLSCTDQAFDGLRTLGMIVVNPGLGTTIKDSPYDNVWYFPTATSEYQGVWGMDKFDETDYDNNDTRASLAVSDHRPLWAQFASGPDDD